MQKCTFFEENARFSRLIDFYANRLKDPHAKGELWGFLWIVKATVKGDKTPNYFAVCLRNEYIRLSKLESKTAVQGSFEIGYNDPEKIDFQFLSTILTAKQFDLCKALYSGFTVSEYARKKGTSRQAVYVMKNNIAECLKKIGY